ncbi:MULTISPECIES: IclR family transcriptional regulator [Desulfotignum]|jgi:IclR family pca regulon transcriptional regulator|uniref:Transcriptional regulator, IclR family n=1 Tax=Desulfotignum phosphitoxidans DSM 13687 TaxID=1286635 RepID=S0FTK7_9BACT|nr:MULTISPECIES: IclR family transcriptional regulator [Desulfotignum]EMS78025.1 transcriptional regulator, IclR family [Desulfotignum phosphitoxidans DSM 13687]
MAKGQTPYFSKSLEKGLRILSLFNQDRISCTQSDISKLTGINMTSTYRFVNTFVELGYLQKHPETKRLKLGSKAISLGHGLLRGFDFLQMIKPIVDETCNQHQITMDVALRDTDALMIIYRRELRNALPYQLPTVIKDLNSTALGKAVLAFLPEQEQMAVINSLSFENKTGRTIIDRDQLFCELALIKKRGYSINNEEFVPGLLALGAPLINAGTNKVAGAICFDFLRTQTSLSEIKKEYAELIIQLAQKISKYLPIS